MILKELDPFTSSDPLNKAGRRAEEQMAFYLRRAFADTPSIRVFNGIRLEREGDAAQIDHLILHRYGVIIIESKSVTSQVEINERGEWTRVWNGRPKGMASPVLQARRQGDFLKRELSDNASSLRGKFLGIQTRFGAMPIDVIAAISDEGVIKQPKKTVEEAVCKADQVPDRVRVIFERLKKESSLFTLSSSGGYQLSEADVVRMSDFLLARHRTLSLGGASANEAMPAVDPSSIATPISQPLPIAHPIAAVAGRARPEAALPSALASPSASAGHVCRSCQATTLSVEYGRYGYYFKCSECGGNTPIKVTCEGCGEKARIRKEGQRFFSECENCGRSTLFHVNSVKSGVSAPPR